MEYKHLNLSDYETRFLRILEPDPSTSLIRAEIVTASLTRAPKYSALSYTWGDERLTKCIQIDGRDVPVARNVEAALKELDLPTGNLIWIDALCVNQNDLYEKSYQVGIMGEIYTRANTVIVWLGEANANTEQATKLLNRIGEASKTESNLRGDKVDLGKKYLTGAVRTSDDPSSALRGLLDLLTRPFWERVWIIQEIAKARRVTVRCGRFQTSLEPIWKIFNYVPRIDPKVKDLLGAIHRFRSSQQSMQIGGIALLEALLMTKRSRATEPRDRVYALLSLTTDGRELVPLADYNTPLESVFSEITTRILARNQQSAVMLLASRTSISWQSMAVDGRSRLAIHWADLHEYVPEWIIRSVLQPEKINQQYTFLVQDKKIKLSATFIATIVDCENASLESDSIDSKEAEENPDRTSTISNTVEAYAEDILYICAELNPSAWTKPDPINYNLQTFADQLRIYRRKDRISHELGKPVNNLLLSPFQRLGPLRYRNRKIWSLARLHVKQLHRRSSRSSAGSDSGSSISRSASSASIQKTSFWNKAEAQLEEDSSFGMQLGVVERQVFINRGGTLSMLAPMDNSRNVYSGIGFLCKEAQRGDLLFLLPGLRYPVVLRLTSAKRYLLIGECILRVEKSGGSMREIFIETKS